MARIWLLTIPVWNATITSLAPSTHLVRERQDLTLGRWTKRTRDCPSSREAHFFAACHWFACMSLHICTTRRQLRWVHEVLTAGWRKRADACWILSKTRKPSVRLADFRRVYTSSTSSSGARSTGCQGASERLSLHHCKCWLSQKVVLLSKCRGRLYRIPYQSKSQMFCPKGSC
jgi:hypothetical protein